MTKTLGLLEWVDQTKVLKEVLERELQEKMGPKVDLSSNNPALKERFDWINKLKGDSI